MKFGRQPGRKGKKAAATSARKLRYVQGRPSVLTFINSRWHGQIIHNPLIDQPTELIIASRRWGFS